MNDLLVIGSHLVALAVMLLAISMASAVVWRVEKSLATCFKLFVAGLLFMFASETFRVFSWDSSAAQWVLLSNVLKIISGLLIFLGMRVMRNITRKERPNKK